MLPGKRPIRTYQRKTTKKPLTNIPLVPVLSIKRYNFNEDSNSNIFFDNNRNSLDSTNHDPFETTFDRVAKGAVVPPLPPDTNEDNVWNSSDSDIKSAISLIKSPNSIASNSFSRKDTSHENIVLIHERKRPQRHNAEVVLTEEILSKKTRLLSTKGKAQSKKNVQRSKKQISKIQKKKIVQCKFKKSSRKRNEEVPHSDTISNLKDVIYKDNKDNTSCDNDNKHLHESILKIDENAVVISQTISNQTNDSIVTFKYPLDSYQSIKSCFVELDTRAVQNWHIQNCEKSIRDKQKHVLCNIKPSPINTSQVNENITKIHKTIPQSTSVDCSIETFKDISIKPCSIKLCDSIMKWNISENREHIKNGIDEDKPVISYQASHNLSEITSPDTNTNVATRNTKKDKKEVIKNNKENLITYSFVKLDRLDIKKIEKEKRTVLNGREQHIVSSTPIGKCIRPSICRVLLSPIDTHYISDAGNKTSTINIKENISIDLSNEYLKRKNSASLNISEHCKMDAINIQEQQTQVLLNSQALSTTRIDSAAQTQTISSDEDIHTAVTQRYNTDHNIERRFLRSLNISADTDQSRSLFGNTASSHSHLADNVENNARKEYFTDMLQHKSAEADITGSSDLPVDPNLKDRKYLLNDNTQFDINTKYASSSETCTPSETESSENLNNIGTKQVYKSERRQSMEIDIAEVICENSKNKSFNDSNQDSSRSQNNIRNIDVNVLLTKLQDPTRITERRTQYSKWHHNMLNISESLRNKSINTNNRVTPYVTTDKYFNIPLAKNNIGHSENTINLFHNYFNSPNMTQCSNDTYMQIAKSVFLKPGKCWTRSLSILNNINAGSDLDKLSIGKGKKWRHSVKNILDMQKQGISRSCLKIEEDDTGPSYRSNASNVSTIGDNKFKTLDSTSNTRFSKRVSVRVVPNNTNIEYNVEDTLFLEVFDIKTENFSRSKVSQQKESPIRDSQHSNDNQILGSNLRTAKDIVLQRCSQKCYLPFSECFPDTYLEHCRKIGEGVYGEVFLYEYNDIKSVIKIIPIEGEQLVNGEPQKKFNEILSEIVIAKELHNLRLHATYKTSGFVEVRGIKCIIGRYPEKLIELWNIYDNNKTSDNDCPSMFGENQLYIALELGHGGEDLEAFVFQTAQEACALFLQTALALAVAEKALEFEHRDLHWGNVLISRTEESHVYYNLAGKEIMFPTNGVKVSIIDFTLSRMSYHECCIYNDLALDPALFTAHGEYQFDIYRLMHDKIQNNWRKFEPYTNVLWLHYTLDKMITAVRYKKKNLKAHKHAITRLKEFKDTILNYDSAFDFISNSNSIV